MRDPDKVIEVKRDGPTGFFPFNTARGSDVTVSDELSLQSAFKNSLMSHLQKCSSAKNFLLE